MTASYPADADGDALRNIASCGSDMSKPMLVNFQVAVPSESKANELAEVAYKLGYRISLYESPGCILPWTCECSSRMLLTYEAVISIQEELGKISKEFEGIPDGWGSFGNI